MSKLNSSDAGIFLWLTYQTLKRMQIDADAIFAAVNLPNQAPDKTLRRDNSTQQRFWYHAELISQNPHIGLHVGQALPFFHGEIIEYLFLSSATFGDGLKRTLQYQKILTTALELKLSVDNDIATISGLEHSVRHYLECSIGVLLGSLRHLSRDHFKALKINLKYTEGAAVEEYQNIWNCPVYLGAAQTSIQFQAALLDLSSPSAQPELLKLHEQLAEQKLRILNKYDLAHQIEQLFSEGLLELGQPDQHLVAEKLGISARTLRSNLQSIHTNFETILNQYREKTARRLLSNSNMSLDQIIYLLGFSEPSAFSRAFKRWTGQSPTQYRKRDPSSHLIKMPSHDLPDGSKKI